MVPENDMKNDRLIVNISLAKQAGNTQRRSVQIAKPFDVVDHHHSINVYDFLFMAINIT